MAQFSRWFQKNELAIWRPPAHHNQLIKANPLPQCYSDIEMSNNIHAVIRGYSRQKEEEDAKLVARENGLPYINLVNYPFSGDVLALIPEATAQKFLVIPFARIGNTVRVATPYPHQSGLPVVMNRLGEQLNVNFEPYVCSLTSAMSALKRFKELIPKTNDTQARAKKESVEQFMRQVRNLTDLSGHIQASSTTEMLETIMSGALAFEATDVHFEPQAEGVRVRFRIDGDLIPITEIEETAYKLLLSRIKNLAKLKLNRGAGAQDGRFTLEIGDQHLDIRVNILPATYGETAEFRLLTGQHFLDINSLGLSDAVKEAIRRNINRRSGMIIVTGPTGSGKTTTLYAILQLLNKPDIKIITIEDPVEYKIAGIEQIQVNPAAGFDFAEALRGILRQDPNVILVGEIRDRETAEIAISASLTGHLVLTTLHTESAPAVFARLLEMGAPAYLLADAIKLIIAQRLEKKICPYCQGRGCDQCLGTGYKGRSAVAEYLEPTPEYEELIRRQASIAEFRELYEKSRGNTTESP